MADPASDEAARNRWMVINAVRIGGVVMVIVAILILRGVVPQPAWAGYVILAVGIVDVFLVPTLLARKWRTPPR